MFRIRAYLTNTYLACFDLAISSVCYAVVLHVESGSGATIPDPQNLWNARQLPAAAATLGLWLALSFYFRIYHSRRMDSPFSDFVILSKIALTACVMSAGLAHLFPPVGASPSLVLRFAILNALVLATARMILRLGIRELRRRGHDVKNLLLVTSVELGDRLRRKIEQRSHYGYRIVKHVVYAGTVGEEDERILTQVRECLLSAHPDGVILALPARANDLAAQLVGECEDHGVNVRIVPDLFPLIQTDTQVYDLDGIPLVNVRLYPTEYFGYVVLKRVFDIIASSTVLVVFSPLYLLIALLVKLTSEGPVLFSQERVGLNGRKFRMLKFRTMRPGAALDPNSHWTVRDDPHVTWIGRWLRRSNLDELPQFFNVLKGDMSIVGPRPERPFFLERFRAQVPEYMARHYVKSGITGWAQVNGWRGDTEISERVAHDLYYIRNWRMRLDIKILVLTMKTFFQRNAY